MEAPLLLYLFSLFLTISHVVLFIDSTNHAFLDSARSENLLYLGSLYSAAISTWALSVKHDDFFSYRPNPPKHNGVPNNIKTSPAMAREKTRYLCVLHMVMLSAITLNMDLNRAWCQGVIFARSLPLVTEIGAFHKMFPMCVSWLTMMWMLGNLIPLMAFGNVMSVGFEAGVEEVARSMTGWVLPD